MSPASTTHSACRLVTSLGLTLFLSLAVGAAEPHVAGGPVDASADFREPAAIHFVPAAVESFDATTGQGALRWDRYTRRTNLSFNKVDLAYARAESNEFPASEYERDPVLPFSVTFVSPRTVRLRFATRSDGPVGSQGDRDSLMLADEPPTDPNWKSTENEDAYTFRSKNTEVRLLRDPWRIEIRDNSGRLVTRTRVLNDPATFSAPTPFSFIRRARDLGRSTAASFQLAPDEKIFGCGESFTRFNKRGQRVQLLTRDAMGGQSERMYKPVPFFISSQGYGMFVHTSTPVTCDFGRDFDEAAVITTGDENLDLFLFVGTPKEILTEYTALTGRSPVPPTWSFGLWMSRITYKSEPEVREVAQKLRSNRIPCDVIHLDTGWFENDWQCDYRFAESRFDDPGKMIADLRKQGLRVCLWQLPYFSRKNSLFREIVDNGFHVHDAAGVGPALDAVLDFSNEAAVRWYQQKIAGLLELGVAAIKVDFGEDAPVAGLYASGRSGWHEHNLYPLRYNKAVAEVTRDTTGESIIWARSAWAGSQRYPLHWGGDAENTDSAMAASLRAGLSLGLCGFSYWSHDVGGFVGRPDPELYKRWLAFGALTSHTRCHGAPPREPWEYGEEFQDAFRRTIELKYRLMPYILAQANDCSHRGHPMLRPLFFEFPNDPGSWLVDDQYFFGSDLLVAPLFSPEPDSDNPKRSMYLPPGEWVNFQTGETHSGGTWRSVTAAPVPVAVLHRSGVKIPMVPVAPSTDAIDWDAATPVTVLPE
ncbi:Alpha-xylosidase [Posidoniimonas polymericola]|uniref:Alpha-xylosidase n=1 Tax=Posidoniimonas polymericola TaxID=2528002 RepID=A0A5C5XUN5_9BACT|nr:TIM-barrel domain-containing protein [Posidoniimonas polymericola]TWT66977.1 Alpha-xylosidase [Posidoniimonas polymericola]